MPAKTKTEDEAQDDTLAAEYPIDTWSDEREGNDVSTLVGSGAPTKVYRAKVGWNGYQVGETFAAVQTEELRLCVQAEKLEEVG